MKRIAIVLAVHAMLGAVGLFACSSDDEAPGGEGADAGLDSSSDSRRPIEAAAEEETGVCAPQPLNAAPVYKPPRPWFQSACTPAQVKGYVDLCFLLDTSLCDAFKQQNPACFACIESKDTDPTWGRLYVSRMALITSRTTPDALPTP